jgi:DNA mismatch repair protein MutS
MWPESVSQHNPAVGAASNWIADLGILDLIRGLTQDRRYTSYIRNTLVTLVTDPDVIRWRQAVLRDFLNNPALMEAASDMLPRLAGLRDGNALLGKRERGPLTETSDRLAELEIYATVIRDLHTALVNADIESAALRQLRENLANVVEDEDFVSLCDRLPELRKPLERISSLTIGINLDVQLRPVSAVLMAINNHKMQGASSFLERVIGPSPDAQDETGIAPMKYLPRDLEQRPFAPLFQDLEKVMHHVAKPVAQELNRYTRVSSEPVVHLEYELAFFVAAARLMHQLQARGIPFCQPEVAPLDERVTEIDGLHNINLILFDKQTTVPSDIHFGPQERIAILTGPNSGGKTTYLQGVGLAHALFQAGLFLPAKQARISPVDKILTHFPALETRQQGRLEEEAQRLRLLFQELTPYSFVLLNETFSSTSSGEALYLAQDVLGGLCAIGTRSIFATHLIELVETIPEIERSVHSDSSLFSLVAGVRINEQGNVVPTYVIQAGQPLGRSYARQIAEHHGISLDQILAIRRTRIDEEASA